LFNQTQCLGGPSVPKQYMLVNLCCVHHRWHSLRMRTKAVKWRQQHELVPLILPAQANSLQLAMQPLSGDCSEAHAHAHAPTTCVHNHFLSYSYVHSWSPLLTGDTRANTNRSVEYQHSHANRCSHCRPHNCPKYPVQRQNVRDSWAVVHSLKHDA